ncbi:MAG: hypothetical protein P1U57_12305 [Oleibacter sp.]|nr:hypothetical protein [Thalassolituus sp.]
MNKTIYRRGPKHRSEDEFVSFREVRERFGFYSVNIGRWVTQHEQIDAALHFYDALCDLQSILQVPNFVISLRGTLALHYGTGGRPGVAAHYSPAEHVFALAKNAGPGSIAHEWFHAFDHYIAQYAFTENELNSSLSSDFASKRWLKNDAIKEHALNERLYYCFQCILLDDTGQSPSALFQHSVEQDKRLGIVYYAKPEEMCARAFEAFIQDAAIKNSFLVSGTKLSDDAKLGLYPTGRQRQAINQAFNDYFSALGLALKHL